jgi:hypothetical protein
MPRIGYFGVEDREGGRQPHKPMYMIYMYMKYGHE